MRLGTLTLASIKRAMCNWPITLGSISHAIVRKETMPNPSDLHALVATVRQLVASANFDPRSYENVLRLLDKGIDDLAGIPAPAPVEETATAITPVAPQEVPAPEPEQFQS